MTRVLRVLVVDDSATDLRLLEQMARRGAPQGSQVDTAGSAERALALLRLRPYDAVISDVHLGDGSGIDVCAQAQRSNPQGARILITSDEDLETLKDSLSRARIDVYLVKRFGEERMAPAVERVLAEAAEKASKGAGSK